MSKIHKFYYEFETLRVWYLQMWPEECPECGEFSKKAKCPNCGIVKPIDEEEVNDPQVVEQLEAFNPKAQKKMEKKLDDKGY